MRLIARQKRNQQPKTARISISEAEISADLHYPASAPTRQRSFGAERRAGRR